MSRQTKAYIAALISVLLWSTAATAFKISLRELDFIQLLFIASLVSLIALSVLLVVQGKVSFLKTNKKSEYLKSAIAAFLNPFAYYLVLLKAYSILPAQIAQPLNYTWPIVLVLLAALILKHKLTIYHLIALFISFSGVFVISTQGNLSNYHISNPLGVILAAGSSILWALFWIINMKDTRDEIVKLFFNFLFGTFYTGITVYLFSDFHFEINTSLYAAIYVGCFEMGFTFALWLIALQLTDSTSKISNLVFLSPFLSLIFIHFILGEHLYYTTYIGIVLIISGIAIQQIANRPKKKQTV